VHSVLEGVRFMGITGSCVRVPLPKTPSPELGLTRARLDSLLLQCARESGTEVFENTPLKRLERLPDGWLLESEAGIFESKELVAADGRNSTVLRQLGLMPPPLPEERIAAQTHLPSPRDLGNDVVLRFVAEGYAGIAPVGENRANLCLVCRPRDLAAIQAWAIEEFHLPKDQPWRTITPLRRTPMSPTAQHLWLVGDTARVVEPFTGEGIAYAIRSGALCAEALLLARPDLYNQKHAALYKGRLWVNQLARWACLNPKGGSVLIQAGRLFPQLFGFLTAKVVR
jgi:flavin-dependent dehydrogenase